MKRIYLHSSKQYYRADDAHNTALDMSDRIGTLLLIVHRRILLVSEIAYTTEFLQSCLAGCVLQMHRVSTYIDHVIVKYLTVENSHIDNFLPLLFL